MGFIRARWMQIAYVTRYAHQPLPALWAMMLPDLLEFYRALTKLVALENAPAEES